MDNKTNIGPLLQSIYHVQLIFKEGLFCEYNIRALDEVQAINKAITRYFIKDNKKGILSEIKVELILNEGSIID